MHQQKRLDVVVAGLALTDIIGRPVEFNRPPKRGALKLIDSITLTTGGNVSNVGIDLARLGFRVGAITRVGNDSIGRFVVQHYRTFGVDTRGVIIDAKAQTSATIVGVDRDGERTFLHTRGCMKNFRRVIFSHNFPWFKKLQFSSSGTWACFPRLKRSLSRCSGH